MLKSQKITKKMLVNEIHKFLEEAKPLVSLPAGALKSSSGSSQTGGSPVKKSKPKKSIGDKHREDKLGDEDLKSMNSSLKLLKVLEIANLDPTKEDPDNENEIEWLKDSLEEITEQETENYIDSLLRSARDTVGDNSSDMMKNT